MTYPTASTTTTFVNDVNDIPLCKTPQCEEHKKLGSRLVPFVRYEMLIQVIFGYIRPYGDKQS